MAGTVPGPRHLDDCRAVLCAVHPRRVGLQQRADLTKIQRPPTATALTLVIARRSAPAAPTTPPIAEPPRPHTSDYRVGLLIELDSLDHRAVIDAEQPTPYLDAKHLVSSLLF
jgi:hypothetical protein